MLFKFNIFLFYFLLIFLNFFKLNNGFNCYAGEDNIYKSIECSNGTKWCLKFVNVKDSTDAIRRCDIANECEKFGDKCSNVQVGDLTDLPHSHLQCCCAKENCNASNIENPPILWAFLVSLFLMFLNLF